MGAAISKDAVLAPDGTQDLGAVPDPVRQGQGSSAEEPGLVSDLDRFPGTCLDREAAFLTDLRPVSDRYQPARGDDPGPREQVRSPPNGHAATRRNLEDDAGPEDDAFLQPHVGRDQNGARIRQNDTIMGEGNWTDSSSRRNTYSVALPQPLVKHLGRGSPAQRLSRP
jgi:hypothetical protein